MLFKTYLIRKTIDKERSRLRRKERIDKFFITEPLPDTLFDMPTESFPDDDESLYDDESLWDESLWDEYDYHDRWCDF
jgi:hypothetical protein|tara:strand:- start:1996 stop:2229 length:234 start_codon:yes stop_codon:yes gene_type:complete